MSKSKLDSLQILRGFASVSVVAHHAFRAVSVNLPDYMQLPSGVLEPDPVLVSLGSAGVDIFFALSGFLMFYISAPYFRGDRSIGHFISQRLIRIWPLYALITAVACVQLFFAGRHIGVWPFDLHPLRLLSFFFVPSFNDKALLQPILGVGWTLNYEMLFYLCFSLLLLSGSRFSIGKIAILITALFLFGLVSPNAVVSAFLGNSIIFEFVFGGVLGWAMSYRNFKPSRAPVWLLGGLGLLLAFAYFTDGSLPRPIIVGIPTALIFVGFLALEGHVTWPKWLRLIGDASYSIYLVHILIVYQVCYRALKVTLHIWPLTSVIAAGIITTVAAVLVGLVCFILIERPLLRKLQQAYNHWTRQQERPPLVAQ